MENLHKNIIHNFSFIKGVAEMALAPTNYSKNFSELCNFSNELLYDCGDTSADFSYHTRRFNLVAIIASSHAVFLQE